MPFVDKKNQFFIRNVKSCENLNDSQYLQINFDKNYIDIFMDIK